MARLEKKTGRTFRELAAASNNAELEQQFFRVWRLMGWGGEKMSRRRIRELVGLHERGPVPPDPSHPLVMTGTGEKIAEHMKLINEAKGEEVFTAGEIHAAALAGVG